jgi:hypothetical protein
VLGSLFSWRLSWCYSPVWNSGGSGSGEEIVTLDVSSKQKNVKFFPDLPREYTTFLHLTQQEINARKKWWLDKKKRSMPLSCRFKHWNWDHERMGVGEARWMWCSGWLLPSQHSLFC